MFEQGVTVRPGGQRRRHAEGRGHELHGARNSQGTNPPNWRAPTRELAPPGNSGTFEPRQGLQRVRGRRSGTQVMGVRPGAQSGHHFSSHNFGPFHGGPRSGLEVVGFPSVRRGSRILQQEGQFFVRRSAHRHVTGRFIGRTILRYPGLPHHSLRRAAPLCGRLSPSEFHCKEATETQCYLTTLIAEAFRPSRRGHVPASFFFHR